MTYPIDARKRAQDVEDHSAQLGPDPGESRGIWLANDLAAEMFATDGFNSTKYLFVALGMDDRKSQFTTPHVLCMLADRSVFDPRYVNAALSYYLETKGWDREYVKRLRYKYFQ